MGLFTRPTGTVIVDVENVKGEISVSPSRLVFTPQSWLTNPAQTVRVYAGVDADADDDTVTPDAHGQWRGLHERSRLTR